MALKADEAVEKLTGSLRQFGGTVEALNDGLTAFLQSLPSDFISHRKCVMAIQSNPNFGRANKRRLIKMVNRH